MRARTLSRIVVAKAVVALTLTAGAGGVALATTSMSLPVEDTETVASTTAAPPTAAIDVHIPDEADERHTDAGSDATSADPADADGSRGLTGLCRAWAAGADSNGNRAASPAFSRLTAAASTHDKVGVDVFCSALAAELPTTKSPTTPTATPTATEPTAKPGQAKRAETAANTTTGKPAAADPNRGQGAQKSSGKPTPRARINPATRPATDRRRARRPMGTSSPQSSFGPEPVWACATHSQWDGCGSSVVP